MDGRVERPRERERVIERWLDTLLENGTNVVAVDPGGTDGERIVGHAVYTPRDAPDPELAVFVDPDEHDRGIGTECCKQVIARAAAAGCETVELSVERTNRRAIAVYERLGFETVEASGSEMYMSLALSGRNEAGLLLHGSASFPVSED
ncbi:MAG: GNAT family N-acetyltransferase [Halalkalicoccus sp.]